MKIGFAEMWIGVACVTHLLKFILTNGFKMNADTFVDDLKEKYTRDGMQFLLTITKQNNKNIETKQRK